MVGTTRALLAAALIAALAALAACGDSGGGQGDNGGNNGGSPAYDCETLSGGILASEWVRETTAIERYTYSIESTVSPIIRVELVDAEGRVLGELVEEQVFGDPSTPDGTMAADLTTADGARLSLTSRGELLDGGYAVDIVLSNDDTSVGIVATFARERCAPPSQGPRPACLAPLPLEEPEFTAPSCGLIAQAEQALGYQPVLVDLTYRVEGEASSPPGPTDWTVTADQLLWSTAVLTDGVPADADALGGWLSSVGTDAIVGTPAETLLTAAFLDPVWRQEVEQHTTVCTAETDTQQQTLSHCLSDASDADARMRTIRQPGCGEAGGRDLPSWVNSGNAPVNAGLQLECGANGCSLADGDPHLTTFDGHAYDFQGAGEYVMARAVRGEPLEVQARMQPVARPANYLACTNVSVTTAAAVALGDHRLGFYVDDPQVRLDAQAVDSPTALQAALGPGYAVSRDNNRWAIGLPRGGAIRVELRDDRMDLAVDLPAARQGDIVGLFGYFSGTTADDMRDRAGDDWGTGLSFEELYASFGESWRVTPSVSLFDYGANESTETYTDRAFPSAPVSFDDVPAAVMDEARQECAERGVDDPVRLRECTLDVICLSSPEAAESHADNAPPLSSQPPEQPGLVLAGDIRLADADTALLAEPPHDATDYCAAPPPRFIRVITEQTTTAGADLAVDATAPGPVIPADGQAVATGTDVRSYLLHLNLTHPDTGERRGTVTFPTPIVGVIVDGQKLAATDGPLGTAGTDVPPAQGRGPDSAEQDAVIWETDRRVAVDLYAVEGMDQLRVITEAPAP